MGESLVGPCSPGAARAAPAHPVRAAGVRLSVHLLPSRRPRRGFPKPAHRSSPLRESGGGPAALAGQRGPTCDSPITRSRNGDLTKRKKSKSIYIFIFQTTPAGPAKWAIHVHPACCRSAKPIINMKKTPAQRKQKYKNISILIFYVS